MTEIPVYNKLGQTEYILEIDDDIEFVSGRTSKSSEIYYKGVGSRYFGHSSLVDTNSISKASVFYYGWNIVNPEWCNKFGIFQDWYQPYFSDYIGTCGHKELKIIHNSRNFRLSAVDVVDCVEHDTDNKQYYFKLKYRSPRTSYLGNSSALISLMSEMVLSGWNFPWDKTSINDINNHGHITDVADIFESNNIIHCFGTVYSVFYSLFNINKDHYCRLLKTLNCSRDSVADIPFIVMLFLKNIGRDVYIKKNIKTQNDMYVHLVGNVLLRGRNCAGVENSELSSEIMIQYLDRFRNQLNKNDSRVLDVY